jgi:hypothetical protein
MSEISRSRTRRIDPDRLAVLEDERDFLLAALASLDDELSEGEIDETDYAGLKDDYTRRCAEALRGIETQRAVLADVEPRSWKRVAAWIIGLAVLGGLAGYAMGQASGDRVEGDTFTGGVRRSVTTRLAQAQGLLSNADRWPDAIALYDDVLEDAPGNVEAITYQAWVRYRSGDDPEPLLIAWTEAMLIDDAYADAVVFRSIALADLERYDEAAEVLDALLGTDLDPGIEALLTAQGLRGRIYGEARYETLSASAEPTLDALQIGPAAALEAANYLLGTEKEHRAVSALKLYNAVLTADPEDALALVSRATLYAAVDADAACADLEAFARLARSAPLPDSNEAAMFDRAERLTASLGCQ